MADVLDQEEIDSLLTALDSGEVDVDEMKEEEEDQVKEYDFRRPDKLSKEQMRTLQMIHENMMRLLTTTLSTKLRTVVDFEVASIEQLSYEEFTRSLPEPTIIGISELEPFSGQFLLEINPDIGFAIIDRLFGGFGEPLPEGRSFTDIEETVLKKVLNWFLSTIPEAWENILRVTPRLRELESNPQFTQIVPSNDMTIIITFSAKIGESEGLINICLPYIMLEPIVPQLSAQQWFASSREEQTAQHLENLKRRVRRAPLEIEVELGNTELTVSDLLFLQPGDVVRLDKLTDEMAEVRIGSNIKYRGVMGTRHNHKALRVMEVVEQEEEGDLDDE